MFQIDYVVLGLSLRTLGCHSSNRKHQSNRTKGTWRTKSTYKRLKELGFHSSPLHSSPRAQFIHIRIFYKDRNAPPTTQILRHIPNRRGISGPFRLWPPPVSAFLAWSLLLYSWHKGPPPKEPLCLYCSGRLRLFVAKRRKGITCTTRAYQVEMKVSCWAKGLLHPSDEMPSTRPKDLSARRKAFRPIGRRYLPMTMPVARRQCR